MQKVNAAIWTPERLRARGYRANALRVIAASGECDEGASCERFWKDGAHGRHMDGKTITKHAEHVEVSWRLASTRNPPSGAERPVFPLGFGEMTDRFSTIAGKAADVLEAKIEAGFVEDRDLVAMMKLGGSMSMARQRHEDSKRQPQTLAIAIMGVVSGHLTEPEGEVRNVTPPALLMEGLRAEREELEALAGYGEDDDEGSDRL